MRKTDYRMNIKKWAYLIVMLAFLLYLIFANNLIAKISNGPYQIKSVNPEVIEMHDLVYYGLNQVYIQNDFTERVYFDGWAFCETINNNRDKYVSVILKSDKETLEIQGLKTVNSNIYDYYKNNSVKINGVMHGFNILFSTVGIKNGIYDLYIYVKENDINYGAISTGIKFIKDRNGFRELKNEPIQNFPEAKTTDNMRFEFDSVTIKEREMKFKGWGVLFDADTRKSKVYLEVCDNKENVYIYKIAQSVRKDIAEAYNTDKYILSGIQGTLDLGQIPDGPIELRFIVENDDFYRSSQVKKYEYNSKDKDDGLKFIAEENRFGVIMPFDNFPTTELVNKIRFEIDSLAAEERILTLSGWGILSDVDSSKSKVYIEVKDFSGNAYVYPMKLNARPDIQQAYQTDKYLLSGITGTLDIRQVKDGEIEIRLIIENNGYYKSNQVKTYLYQSKDNTLKLIK